MRLTLLILLAAFTSQQVHAQKDFVVTLKGDTLRGEVRILSYDLIDRVQRTYERKKTAFTALQLRGVYLDGQFYAPIKYDNAIRLMKVIRSGYLSLYAFKPGNTSTYDGRILFKMGSTPVEVPNLAFKKIMSTITSDCADLTNQIKNGDLGRNDIEQIVDLYNECVKRMNEKHYDTPPPVSGNPTLEILTRMREKVNVSTLATKSEVLDVLSNIQDKVKKNEPVPTYLTEGLKSYLEKVPEFKDDLDSLLTALKK